MSKGPLTGKMLGEYRVGELLGKGAFGEVYRAEHPRLGTRAIKVLQGNSFKDTKSRKRFLREARLQANMADAHIMPIHDLKIEDHQIYMVMPLMPGGTLRDILNRQKGPLPLDQVTVYLEEMAKALDYAHAQKILHLDVKPQNFLVDAFGHLLLSDFGLAHEIKEGILQGDSSLWIGTLRYMAPERLKKRPDRRSDLYSLGIILFEMLAGQPPFQGETYEILLSQHMLEQPPLLSSLQPDLPEELDEIMERALAKDPGQRYRAARELVQAFKHTRFPLSNDPPLYPEPVLQAMNASYLQWRSVGDLGPPEPVDESAAVALHSRRGTGGYSYPFASGALYWSERGGAQPVWGRIFGLFDVLNGVEGNLGFPITAEIPVGPSAHRTSGVVQRFEGPDTNYPAAALTTPVPYGASVYFSEPHDAHPTWGSIGACYEYMGGAAAQNPLGFPTSLPIHAATSRRGTRGSYQRFEGGTIHCAKNAEAIPILGEISQLYRSLEGSRGPLGFPLAPQIPALSSFAGTTGLVQRFEGMGDYPQEIETLEIRCGASIYWSKKYDAHPTWGEIGAMYERLGGTRGVLGFPTSPEIDALPSRDKTKGRYQCFEGGIIYWSKKYGAIPVLEPILTAFKNKGDTNGKYGFPTSSQEISADGECLQEFERGGILIISSPMKKRARI